MRHEPRRRDRRQRGMTMTLIAIAALAVGFTAGWALGELRK